jgi:hypothetical protein
MLTENLVIPVGLKELPELCSADVKVLLIGSDPLDQMEVISP